MVHEIGGYLVTDMQIAFLAAALLLFIAGAGLAWRQLRR